MFYCFLLNIWLPATAVGSPWTRLTISLYLWRISNVLEFYYISVRMQAILLSKGKVRALRNTAGLMQFSATQSVVGKKYKEI